MDDEDLEGLEEDEQPQGFAALPKETQTELKKLRSENKGLRDRLGAREAEVLSGKYGDLVELLPQEVTSWDSKETFLEKLKAKMPTPVDAVAETDESAETQAPEPVDPALAAVTSGPTATADQGPKTMSVAEWEAEFKDNPKEAVKKRHLVVGSRSQPFGPR